MSDMFSNFDPQSMAQQFAQMDLLSLQNMLQKQQTDLTKQKDAYSKLEKALQDFRSAIDKLNKGGGDDGMMKNKVTISDKSIMDITTNSTAKKGTYNIFVKQLANADQIDFKNLTDQDIANSHGKLVFSVNGKKVTVDLGETDPATGEKKIKSLGDLADAINHQNIGSNPSGATASLIKANGKVTLMISSDNTGAANKIQIDASQSDAKFVGDDNIQQISTAQDAIVYLGDEQTGIEHRSSTNKINDLIHGVTLDLKKSEGANKKPIVVNIDVDDKKTKKQVNAFIKAYNALQDAFDELTKTGTANPKDKGDGNDDKKKSTDRGALAGNTDITSLENKIHSLLHPGVRPDGKAMDLTQFGITMSKDGRLELDDDKLKKALQENPQAINDFFNGSNGVIHNMDNELKKYLNSSDGLIKSHEKTLDNQQRNLDDRTSDAQRRYQDTYNRYLKEFSALQQTMTQINQSMGLFQ